MTTMTPIYLLLARLRREERAQDMVEYALMVSLLAVGLGLFAPELSASMETIYSRVASKVAEAASI